MRIPNPLPVLAAIAVGHAQPPAVELPAGSGERLQLEIETIEARPIADPVRAIGRVELDPTTTAVVASRIQGQIAADPHRVGARVESGEDLLTLRSGELAAAVARYIEAEQNLRFAESSFAREQDLADRKLTTTEALRQRRIERDRARTSHLAAIQIMHLLGIPEARLHLLVEGEPIRDDLSLYTIPAPISGVVIEKQTRPGDPVEPNQVLLTIADPQRLLVEFKVPLRGVARVRPGLEIAFHSTVGEPRQGRATLLSLVPSADRRTLSATALASLDNPDGEWIAGTPVELLIPDPDAPELPAVPVGAVVDVDGTPCVFLALDDDRFQPVPARPAATSSDWIGLDDRELLGRRAVTGGTSRLLAAWHELQADH